MNDGKLIAREAAISAVINGVLSFLFFMLVFGVNAPVALSSVAVDGLPQSFMVAFMGSLVPGLIIASRRGRAKRPVVVRAVLIGLGCLVILGGSEWLILHRAPDIFSPIPVLITKTVYGAVLGALVTPLAVHRVLHQEARP